MVTLTVENGESAPPMGRGLIAAREFALRIIGAVLQIGATIAVVQVLPPTVAGIYFKGVIIAYGLAALLRGKYELFIAQHFVNPQQSELGARARAVVRALGIRVLIRSAIACAALLVVTCADMKFALPSTPVVSVQVPVPAALAGKAVPGQAASLKPLTA